MRLNNLLDPLDGALVGGVRQPAAASRGEVGGGAVAMFVLVIFVFGGRPRGSRSSVSTCAEGGAGAAAAGAKDVDICSF